MQNIGGFKALSKELITKLLNEFPNKVYFFMMILLKNVKFIK